MQGKVIGLHIWLTVSLNLAVSLANPQVKYTSSSPGVGAVNFLEDATPDPLEPMAFCCRIRRVFLSMMFEIHCFKKVTYRPGALQPLTSRIRR